MNLRPLGDTGLKVSEIGMGCEGFSEKTDRQVKGLFDLMEAGGINVFDLYSPDPAVRSAIGRAIAGRRDHFVIQAHLCTVWKNGQYERTRRIDEVKEGFEDLLSRLGTDFIDIGMIHYVDSLEDWKTVKDGEVSRYARQLKKEGRIHCIGMSSHNPEAAIAAVKSGLIDVLMFSVNPCYDLLPGTEDCDDLWDDKNYEKPLVNMDPKRQELYELCQRKGVGITVMKAFGGGDLLSSRLSPAGRALSVNQCLHYALTRPAVAAVMCGAHTPKQLKESLAYESASDQEKDYAQAFAQMPRISWQGHCMYCGHCAPCPKGIDVAAVTKFLNLAAAQKEVPETVREHYALLPHTASECVQCGACEKRCPFGVQVRANMKKAAEVFGK
jgi:predicted aldo/keto reductase-like oxidoreductase